MAQASHGGFPEACSSALPCAVADNHRTVRNLGAGLLGLPDPVIHFTGPTRIAYAAFLCSFRLNFHT